MIRVINTFIYILPLTYGAHAVVILVMVSLNVLRRPRLALFLIIIRLIALYLPLAYIGGLYLGDNRPVFGRRYRKRHRCRHCIPGYQESLRR